MIMLENQLQELRERLIVLQEGVRGRHVISL